MKHEFSTRFTKAYRLFPGHIQLKFDKQLRYLLRDIRHPSLHAKKYDEANDIWQARVDKGIRFYFVVEGETYILLDIKRHD